MGVINCMAIVQSLDIREAMCCISICLDFPSKKLNLFSNYCRYDSEKTQVGNMEDCESSEKKYRIIGFQKSKITDLSTVKQTTVCL